MQQQRQRNWVTVDIVQGRGTAVMVAVDDLLNPLRGTEKKPRRR
jgi:hypothetical protein